MFSNLQNKIDLKKIKDSNIEIDSEFAFKEGFDIVNQTLGYFAKKKHEPNNIIIKEEVTMFENEELLSFLEENVKAEQKFIYNDTDVMSYIKKINDDVNKIKAIDESYEKYHKEKRPLDQLLEEANEELKTAFDAYRMVGTPYEEVGKEDFSADALFDKDTLEMAKHEHLDQIYTTNWLEKQLVDYRKSMNDSLSLNKEVQINNGLKSLDVSDTDEIKNKIKDIQESVRFLNSLYEGKSEDSYDGKKDGKKTEDSYDGKTLSKESKDILAIDKFMKKNNKKYGEHEDKKMDKLYKQFEKASNRGDFIDKSTSEEFEAKLKSK